MAGMLVANFLQSWIYRKDCVHIQTNLIDQTVSQRVLEVLQPEQFQIALRAVNELQQRSETIDGQWRMRIERLDYQAQLVFRCTLFTEVFSR